MAPACPIVLPFGAVSPAINPTTGFFVVFFYHSAAIASRLPPISPIITIPSVSSSFIKSSTASFVVVPIIGSPPIPMAVVIPNHF